MYARITHLSICMRNKSQRYQISYVILIIVTQQNLWTEIAYFYSKVKKSIEKTIHRPNSSTHFWLLQNIHIILGCICQVS